MCNACGFLCCGSDQFGGCGCESCGEEACLRLCRHCGENECDGVCQSDDALDPIIGPPGWNPEFTRDG